MIERYKKFIAVGLVAILLLAFTPTLLNIVVPGPEGVRSVNYGIQFRDTGIYRAGSKDPLPPGFNWVSNQPGVMVVEHERDEGGPVFGMWEDIDWYYNHDSGKIRSEVQRARLTDDPLASTSKILEYYRYSELNETQVKIEKVVLTLIPAEFIIQISAVAGSGVYTWKNVNLWYALDTVTWMNAYADCPPEDPDPLVNETTELSSANYRGAFPIFAWIESYKDWTWEDEDGRIISVPPDENAMSYVQLDPSLEGRSIDLYTEPNDRYDLALSSDVLQNEELLSKMLEPNKLPDPRFAQTVYFYITLTNFGCYVKPTGTFGGYSSHEDWYPSVYYKVRVVYAMWGEYVYLWTKSAAEEVEYEEDEWEVRTTEVVIHESPWDHVFDGIADWFSANAWWIWLIVAAVVVVIVLQLLPRRR